MEKIAITIHHVVLGMIEAKLRQLEGHDYLGMYVLACGKHLGVIAVKWSYFIVSSKWADTMILARYDSRPALEEAKNSLTEFDRTALEDIFSADTKG